MSEKNENQLVSGFIREKLSEAGYSAEALLRAQQALETSFRREGMLSEGDRLLIEPAPSGGHTFRFVRAAEELAKQRYASDLPPDHYRAQVSYAGAMLSRAALLVAWNPEWGNDPAALDELYRYEGQPFELHSSCVNLDRTPGEKIFYLHDVGDGWKAEEQIAWGLEARTSVAPNGYRPATHEEVYEFAKAYPEFADFAGLGSYATEEGERWMMIVAWIDSLRDMNSIPVDGRFRRVLRVLFVVI